MKKLIMILTCIIASVGLSVAQTTLVSGTVIDDTGETVIGASVVAKGSTVGTVTDIDGKFTLNIPADRKTLLISLIGYKTKEVTAGTNINVKLEQDSKLIDEIVVTAMGITREKKALGYASQGISTEVLNQTSNTSLSSAMQGKISGVNITPSSGMPGSSSQITIRGARSFDGNNTPLYVVDGMPISSSADIDTEDSTSGTDFANRAVDIDPANIESIEILKGQAAAALYGIRASNGVIIITTKSGKNLKKGKPQITLNSTVSFEKLTRYLKNQTKYAQGSGGVFNPTSSLSWGPLISELPNDAVYGGNTTNEYTNKYGKQPGKYYVPQLANAGLDPWATPESYDNSKDFFETGLTLNNSINVAQALENGSYSLFLSSAHQDGVIPSTGMTRYTAGFNVNTKLAHNWTTGFAGSYINSKITKSPSANSSLLATLYGAPASYNLKGIPSSIKGNPYVQNHYRGGGFDNPYWGVDHNKFEERTSRFYGNGFVNYETRLNTTDKKLNIKYQLGVDSYTTNYRDLYGYGSRQSNQGRGDLEEYERRKTVFNSLLISNFNWNITDDWNINAVLGNEYIDERLDALKAKASLFNYAGWDHMKNATQYSTTSFYRSKRSIGFFGNIDLSYKNMLYFGITGRNDIVSYMPRDNRSFFYPSVNASFIFTELEVLKDRTILDFGKVRVSYAEVGQAGDYYNSYYYTPTFGGGFYSFTPVTYPINGVSPSVAYPTIYDPNLKAQNTRSYEIGLDATFLKGLIDISYTYSNQNVKDQIFEIPLAGSTGFSSIVTNGGKMLTDVHEISLKVNPIRTNLIDWSIGLNWTKIKSNVKELAEGVDNISLGGFVTPQIRVQKGVSYPVIYGVDYKRDSKGRILVNENPDSPYYGMPLSGKADVIGKVSPDFILGINTNLRIQKFTVSAVFDWKSGGQMYHGTNGVLSLYGVRKDTDNRDQPLVFNGYKEDGSKNDIVIDPSRLQDFYNHNNNIDASAIYDSDYFKLRELGLGYIAYKSPKLEVGVNAFARNILIWSKIDNFDPEASQGNNNMSGGFERFSLPAVSSYGFGVNVKF